jgi:alpha-N-arabinofuranosidase
VHYQNPVLPGFYPDPSICRVGDDFYLVTSSFEYFPAVPIFHSRDLVHWQQIGHVLTRKRQLDLTNTPASAGIYAPTLRYANGRYYLITTNIDRYVNFFVTAKKPEGPWSDPIEVDRGGIDPSLTFDDDTVYYTRNGKGRDTDHPVIQQARIDVATGQLLEKMRTIWRGTGGIWPEAPHLLKHDGWYYLVTAEGGTSYGHSIVVARSRRPFGPFVGAPHNPVLTQRTHPRSPIQAAGHADLVQLDDGSWWSVMLAIRPTGGKYHHLGRETFLAPVTFDDNGWPHFGVRGMLPARSTLPRLRSRASTDAGNRPVRDDFEAPQLAFEWQFIRNPAARAWSLRARPGHLRLVGSAASLDDVASQSAVVRRQQHFLMRCRTKLAFCPRTDNEEAGLLVRAREGFHYSLGVRLIDGKLSATLASTVRAERSVLGRVVLSKGPWILEVTADAHHYSFCVWCGTRKHALGQLPTRPLSSEYITRCGPMHFTGVVIGVYALGNGRRCRAPADFDWFEYAPIGAATE